MAWVFFFLVATALPAQEHLLSLLPSGAPAALRLEGVVAREVARLRGDDAAGRAHARRRLVRLAWHAAVPALEELVRGGGEARTTPALLTLADLEARASLPLILRVAADRRRRAGERVAALLATGRLGGRRAVAGLARVLRLSRLPEAVATAAAVAAARLGDPRLREPLLRLLAAHPRPDRTRAAAVVALARTGAPPAAGLARRLAGVGDPRVRRGGYLAAMFLPGSVPLAVLAGGLRREKNDPWGAAYAAVALGWSREARAQGWLRTAARSREAPVRRYALRGLAAAAGREAVRVFLAATRDREPEVRAAAWAALAATGYEGDPGPALRDPAAAVRQMGVLLLAARPEARQTLDRVLLTERDPTVLALALAARVAVTGRWLPPGDPVRRGPVSRLLRSPPWRGLEAYRDEREAPPWRRAARRYAEARRRLRLEAVRAELLNRWVLEVLDLEREREHGEARGVLGSGRGREGAVVRRRRSTLPRAAQDLRVWLQERPYFD